MHPQDGTSGPSSSDRHIPETHLRLVNPTTGELLEHPLLAAHGGARSNTPRWLRLFFSLRVQLMFTFCLIQIMVIILVSMLLYKQTSNIYISLVALGAAIVGSLLALFFITLLLQPLWRVTDAAQAIAIGDLKQRKRLPLRLPPQDEIDRLAGSLNEMVTRLEYAEEMQRASEQRFQRFFSDASHQLRTPLTSIRGFTEVLMRGAKDDPETAMRVLKRMKSESERMTYLINDILTLSRLDDQNVPNKQHIDLIELATEAIEQAKTRAKDERTISLIQNTQEEVYLLADREHIKQLLFVLLDNALKHGRAGADGIITMRLDKSDKRATIHVTDNGNGITKEDQAHIFDSFYRGHPATPNGTGLGLTIAAAIVRLYKGTISAKSEPDTDTEFTIILPCID